MNAEEKVRAAWEWVAVFSPGDGEDHWVVQLADAEEFIGDNKADVLSDAAAFTDERLKQVAEIEEEIAIQREFVMLPLPEHLVYERTWRRLQAIREELRRGMK